MSKAKSKISSLFSWNLLVLVIFFQACSSGERVIPPSTGKSSEVLVVISDELWAGMLGQEVKDFLGRDIDGLPQPEPMFSIVRIEESAFTSIFQSHRNVLIFSQKPEFTQPFTETKSNLWAKPQRVIKLNASSDTALLRLFNEHKNAIQKLFDQTERARIQQAYRGVADHTIIRQIKETFGIKLTVPQGYYMAVKKPDFMWIRRETLEFSQGLLIYTYGYTDTVSFNPGYILAMRDVMTELYVPGTFQGTHMIVSRSFIPPVSKRIDFNGNFAVETRGLWEVKGDYMGGPFINYTLVDESKNKVLTIDGYVYAPKDMKRDLVRQLEAIIYTLEFGAL